MCARVRARAHASPFAQWRWRVRASPCGGGGGGGGDGSDASRGPPVRRARARARASPSARRWWLARASACGGGGGGERCERCGARVTRPHASMRLRYRPSPSSGLAWQPWVITSCVVGTAVTVRYITHASCRQCCVAPACRRFRCISTPVTSWMRSSVPLRMLSTVERQSATDVIVRLEHSLHPCMHARVVFCCCPSHPTILKRLRV